MKREGIHSTLINWRSLLTAQWKTRGIPSFFTTDWSTVEVSCA